VAQFREQLLRDGVTGGGPIEGEDLNSSAMRGRKVCCLNY
jgi:hypothetical protein